MALAFADSKGAAIKSSYLKYQNGTNTFRLFGGVLARYVYWVPNLEGKNQLLECLGFDRDKERFTNIEKDHVQDFFPDVNCGWAYLMKGIDMADGQVKVIPLKKKYFEAIVATAKKLGDPTDVETGWDVVLDRKSTGSQAYNVEYTLDVLSLEKRPLSADELAKIEEASDISDDFPRATPDEQLATLQEITGKGGKEELPDEVSEEMDTDVPF